NNWLAKIKKNHYIKRFDRKYLGLTFLVIVIIIYGHPSLLIDPVSQKINRARYDPKPASINSPWPWQGQQMIHPAIVNMPKTVETSIKSVAEYIAEQESDPYLRIKALHDYVISRVIYDLEVLQTGNRPPQDAQTVFKTHKAVCEGYANLFMALGKAIGEDVVVITGKVRKDLAPLAVIPDYLKMSKPTYDWTLHAWNSVKVEDNWYLVVTTWDDSSEQSSPYQTNYLMPRPEVMMISHFPNNSYSEDWQLVAEPKNYLEFEEQPLFNPEFFIENLVLISPTRYENNVDKVAQIYLQKDINQSNQIEAVFFKINNQKKNPWWDFQQSQKPLKQEINYKSCQSQNPSTNTVEITCQFSESGEYQVILLTIGQKNQILGQLKYNSL
ncbi:MAG: transglutaminase domain-containing protein, partial [Cyanobacteria bacterium P01_G01_bin.49]